MRTNHAPIQSDEPHEAPGRPSAQSPGRPRVKPSVDKWIVGLLAALVALSAIAGVSAQEEPPEPETANVDVTVWRRISDPSLLYVSTRPEGGGWRTLNTALDMTMESDSGNFHQSNAVRVRVPLEGGGTANVA